MNNFRIRISWQQIAKWVVLGIIGLLVLIFFIRVATWEADYYAQMEGSERDVTETVDWQEELVEEEPTVEEVREYVVAADRPRYLSIEKLGISNARILSVGVTAAGALATPANIFDVGWYNASGKPGEGRVLIIDGHNGGPHVYGVFKRLPELVAGDIIKIERGDGAVFNYKVVENTTVSIDDANSYMNTSARRSAVNGKEGLTLITCTGEWSQAQKTYLSRQFVRAVVEG